MSEQKKGLTNRQKNQLTELAVDSTSSIIQAGIEAGIEWLQYCIWKLKNRDTIYEITVKHDLEIETLKENHAFEIECLKLEIEKLKTMKEDT